MAVAAYLTTGAPPPGDYPTWDAYMADVAQFEPRYDEAAARGLKAMRLAPTLAVCRALLAGQPVPKDALDQRWARRYGVIR